MLTGKKVGGRKIRHLRIRTRVIGTAERPRLAVFRTGARSPRWTAGPRTSGRR